jgi:geranylgeranyl diphosphate synthase type I
MLTLAHLALLRLEKVCSLEISVQAAITLQRACLQLTKGQYLDICYESQNHLSVDEYWQMVGGKTASLLSACTELGSIVAPTTQTRRQAYRDFGFYLGLAFQAQDDILGIWGDAALTGKSSESDLSAKKKSLPVIFGLDKQGDFSKRWSEGPINPEQVKNLADKLDTEGARIYTQESANKMTAKALTALEKAKPQAKAGEELTDLANRLLSRVD